MTKLATFFPFAKEDNVVITEEEHASNAIPWLGIEQKGVEIRFAKSENGVVPIANIVAMMDEHTKIVSTASTYFCSGYAIDLKTLGEECHKRGIILAIDAIQSMGRLTMRPRQWHISYVAGGAHKGCLGTKGGLCLLRQGIKPNPEAVYGIAAELDQRRPSVPPAAL